MQGLFGTHNKVAHIRVEVSVRVDEHLRSRVETASEAIDILSSPEKDLP